MAAVRIIGGQVDAGEPLRRLVDPGEPVPPEASRIHGINDLILKGAPDFRQVWPEFRELFAGTVLIGHTIGFDLAMLLNECRRAGYPWTAPRTLDTRLLAELVEPNLAGFALEQLAAWLNVPVEGRHTATADAVTTARIFIALLPKLRDRGIRTLAEAEQASRGLTAALDAQHRAGWVEPAAPPVERADCIGPGPHRDLPVPASRPRCDDVTGSIHRCTRSAFRSARPHGARADVIAVCALRRRTVRQTRAQPAL